MDILEKLLKIQIREYKIKVGTEYAFLRPADIIRVEADSNYSILHTTSGKLVICQNLSAIEQQLNGWGMVRIGRSHIINVVHIDRLKRTYPSHIIMSDGTQLEIPKRSGTLLIRRLERLKLG